MSLKGRLHYAWIVSFAGLLIAGAGTGIINSTLGVFVKPVCEDLGFLRGQFSTYGSISMLVSVILMPLFGSFFKRFGFRRVAIPGAVICGFTLLGYSVSSELWQFYVFAFVSGLFVNGFGIMAIGILVNNWFIDKKGLATGIAFSGSGLLAAILIPIANKIIELQGWRWTYRFLAFVSLFVLIPVLLFIIKDRPEDAGLEPYRSGKRESEEMHPTGETGLTRGEAFRTASFWLLAIAVMGITLCQGGPHVHTISFLNDIGYSAAYASTVSSVYMIFLTGFKVIMGLVFDRLGPLKGSMLIGGCCVLFPVFALFATFPVSPWIYALALGLASSGATVLGPILTGSYYGRKDFSRIYSIISMFSFIGVVISSPFFGSIYDVTGSYTLAWFFVIGMGIVVCICLIGAYRTRKKIVYI